MFVSSTSLYRWAAIPLCALFLIASSHVARAEFLPSDLGNLEVWFDAADVNGDGSTVAAGAIGTWVDKANGYNATQATSTSQPSLTTTAAGINGLQVVRFDGTSDYLFTTAIGPYSAKTVLIAYRVGHTLQGSDLGQLWGYYPTGQVAVDDRTSSATYPKSWSFNGGGGATAKYGLDGRPLTASAYGDTNIQPWHYDTPEIVTAVFTSTLSMSAHYLGRLDGSSGLSGHNYGGDIAEILVYSDTLSDAELYQVRQYLGDKWEVSVPEPSTFAMLLGLAGVGLLGYLRRRRKA